MNKKQKFEKSKQQGALDLLWSKYGKDVIFRYGDGVCVDVESFSTGALSLDMITGVMGVPKGRIIEIYGPESSGKTTLALHISSEVQKKGGSVAFIDAEHALDFNYAAKIGVDIDNVLISQPDYGEQALDIVENIAAAGIELVVIDSVAALVPKSEIEGDFGNSQMALHARLMSQAMRKLTAIVKKNNSTLIFINQIREKIGVMFGNPETTTGGRALKFYSSMRMEIRRIATIKNGDVSIGNKTKVKIVKNKVGSPFRETIFNIIYGVGVDKFADMIELAVFLGIILKSGSWYSYKDNKLGQGIDNCKEWLSEFPDVEKQIRNDISGKI